RRHFWACLIAATTLLALRRPALMAQGTTGPVVRDTNVGYIDPAIPGDVIRTRVDASYGNVRPTRAAFFWSAGGPFARGPPLPDAPGVPTAEPPLRSRSRAARLDSDRRQRFRRQHHSLRDRRSLRRGAVRRLPGLAGRRIRRLVDPERKGIGPAAVGSGDHQ